MTQKITVTY